VAKKASYIDCLYKADRLTEGDPLLDLDIPRIRVFAVFPTAVVYFDSAEQDNT